MKLTVLLLTLGCLHVNATAFSQKITLSGRNVSIEKVFKEVRKQTGYLFLYNNELLQQAERISIHVTNASLEEVLQQCFEGQPLTYAIVEKTIIIKPLEKLELKISAPADGSIKGKVSDSQGITLPGVTVKLEGTTRVTVTDASGNYSFSNLPAGKYVLIFSYIGFSTTSKQITLSERQENVVDVTLTEQAGSLDEVVVVGYGTQKKANLTGSVDVVSGEQLENRPATKVADLLKGTSPNLNISMNSRGGEPGAASRVNIRGIGSINGNAAPLILVDGVEIDINNVDPESIESVSVLKDASASAIYGSRAPFGVILITTKKGAKGEKVNIQYNNTLSSASPIRPPSQVDALTWATAYNQANANASLPALYSDEQMERIKGYMAGTFPHEYDPKNPISGIFLGRRNGNANYDWGRLMYKDNSFNQKHNINVSGGSENTQYYIAGGFTDQDGLYNFGYDLYKRYNFLANISTRITNWLSVNSSLKYAKGNSDYPLGITTVGRDYSFGEFITWSPMTPMYNINGTIQNPLVRMMQDGGRDKLESNDFLIALGAELEPLKGWKTNISYNHNVQTEKGAVNPKPVMVELGNGAFGNIGKPTSGYQSIFSQPLYSLFNVVSSYEKQVTNHYFKVLGGYEQEEKSFSSLNGTGSNLITIEVPSLSTALGNKTVTDQMWNWATLGVFGRLNYNFKEKYLLEFSARYNGSSRFAEDLRWGFFPSASVGYNISKESFWEPIKPYVNTLKFRGSYGALGNQNVDNYLYLERMNVVNELNWLVNGERPPYAFAPALISDDLTWETITTLNLGFDAEMLNNRLGLVFDLFNRETTDMTGPVETPTYLLGTSAPFRNNASLSTKGFEVALSWNDRITPSLSYNARVSMGDSKSTILEYRNDKGLIDTWYNGKEYGEIWGYITDGLIQTAGETMPNQSFFATSWGPGDMKYKDLNGDGVINPGSRTLDDHGDLTVIGNSLPRFNYSMTAGINWKGFDFSMFWQGLGKHDYYPHSNASMFWGMNTSFGSSTILKDSPALDYWRPATETNMFGPNTDAYFAKPYFNAQTTKNRQTQSRYLLNGAYLRLKNMHVGYTLPQKLANKMFLQKARIYMAGENLLTFSDLPKVYDPETVFAGNTGNVPQATYPASRYLTMGLNLTF